ncbi:MAG TPA: hypothetical protein VGN08_10515 [Solirubrobacteraceae bacterium]
MRLGALVLVALALTGCETTAQKSAKLERAAKRLAAGRQATPAATAVTHPSSIVRVVRASLIRSSEGAAAIVTLRNASSKALTDLPIAITVKDAAGRTLFQNNATGLEAALVSVPSLAPHATVTWVDDQIPAGAGGPGAGTVIARVGESRARAKSIPRLPVTGLHLIEDPTNGIGASGVVTNGSATSQRSLVVFVLATRGGVIVAAGRAVVPEAPAHSARPFTVFFIGDPHGTRLQATAAVSPSI